MTLLLLFVKAVGYGLAVAAPVGPMSLLCMRRTLARGWRQGLATGCGIAAADGTYAAVAALGLAGVSSFLLAHERPLHLAAGLVLAWLGLRIAMRRQDAEETRRGEPDAGGAGSDAASWPALFGGTLLLTLANPMTVLMFAAVFASLAPAAGFAPGAALLIVAGVTAGSLLWWIGVVAALSAFQPMLGSRARRWIDRVAGGVLLLAGLVETWRAL